jgi:hypothetical protein
MDRGTLERNVGDVWAAIPRRRLKQREPEQKFGENASWPGGLLMVVYDQLLNEPGGNNPSVCAHWRHLNSLPVDDFKKNLARFFVPSRWKD